MLYIIISTISGYGIQIGQNMAQGSSSWDAAIQEWFDEHNNFDHTKQIRPDGSWNGGSVQQYKQVK